MIREVYINNQLIDIEADNVAGYIFTSPIFRDISMIVSNRTTTYKIPKTTNNLAIFGQSENPDVQSLAPYREHSFREDRDGLPFIQGVCRLLKTAEKELELVVYWGNSEKLQVLKDIKLTDLKGNSPAVEGIDYVIWNDSFNFLSAPDQDSTLGFLKIDFGRGVDEKRFIHPCVNVQYILNLIKRSTGITIDYPSRFKEEFRHKWLPLIDKNANGITWASGKYHAQAYPKGIENLLLANFSYLRLSDSPSPLITQERWGTVVNVSKQASVEIGNARLTIKIDDIPVGETYELTLNLAKYLGEGVYDKRIVTMKPTSEGYAADFGLIVNPLKYDSQSDEKVCLMVAYRVAGSDRWRQLDSRFQLVESELPLMIEVRAKELEFGDRYPVIPNLPDLSVLDFLKSLMSMYGLFTYHDFKVDADVVKFVSIDDMYSYKNKDDKVNNPEGYQALDWTNKLLLVNGNRMKLEYTYGIYAQKNYLKYKNDKDVTINANGFIEVDNQGLEPEKNLIEIPYSPSYNVMDVQENSYARIPLYDEDDNYSSVGVRILNEGEGYKVGVGGEEGLKSALFDDKLKFSNLIAKHYSKYQAVLKYPVVVECAVYLSDAELHLFREIYPIYIDGVYYMPISVTVQTNGIANCKLIKMPPM